ncbi:hypothetical protein [Altererythrobacter rubellus]|uniref:Uncharacterized protein n=1 Tax=Altererythrobacter rubellus TaxID=2173831 RepID=A0A9Y2F4X8_9SPHN|nr:hypothetical protein [Altererythrobacter rubellus]WIW95455.1 hypothetical protein QQX03_11050 [Altererythrobacter rubellus]
MKFTVPKKPVEEEIDIDLIRNVLVNATRLGDFEYANRAKRRLWELHKIGETELERRFGEILAAYESFLSERNQRNTKASRTWQKIRRHGVKRALIDWATSKTEHAGFKVLVEEGNWDMTAEYLVVSMANEFEPPVVAAARQRLLDAGVSFDLDK